MGRSQVKFRTTHGRGRGRGRGAEATSSGRGAGANSSGVRGGRRPLESNAFRYAEEHDGNGSNGDADEQLERDSSDPLDAHTFGFRRQFFAGEENVRGTGATPSDAYFQSRAVKQWDADDAEDDTSAVGVLDLHWIGEQLALVAPSVRYQMDPKYCVDFAFEPQDDDAADEGAATSAPASVPTPLPVATAVDATPRLSTDAQPPLASATVAATGVDNELDRLLQLSASIPQAAPTLLSTIETSTQQTSNSNSNNSSATQLEDWLDDVLDM